MEDQIELVEIFVQASEQSGGSGLVAGKEPSRKNFQISELTEIEYFKIKEKHYTQKNYLLFVT